MPVIIIEPVLIRRGGKASLTGSAPVPVTVSWPVLILTAPVGRAAFSCGFGSCIFGLTTMLFFGAATAAGASLGGAAVAKGAEAAMRNAAISITDIQFIIRAGRVWISIGNPL
ncbi:MAG: hypothetical protein ACYC69_18170 [Thermodesulfovibrionales bacterium]